MHGGSQVHLRSNGDPRPLLTNIWTYIRYFARDRSFIRTVAGRVSGIRHSSLIDMLTVIDGNKKDNLLLFIREEN
jgi:hypothetical protein